MNADVYKSATFKLTAWYLGIIVAISLVFSGVVYHFANQELATGLYSQSRRIYETFPVFSGNPFFRRNTDLENGSRHILLSLSEFNIFVFVVAGFASYGLARRTLRPIEEANERQKRFVADASHELRTPLTALKMSTEVALADNKIPRQDLRTALQSNLEEVNKLDTLLNNLLRLSQFETDDLRHKFTTLSTKELVKEAIAQIQSRSDQRRIAVANETKEVSLSGDKDSLVQLMVILLDNAIKYSPEESIVTLSSQHINQTVYLTVSDKGIGIEPSALEHVFDRFYRADKARSRQESEGFGLGLSIAKHIVDLHNGSITIKSIVGKGTKATVILPDHLPPPS